MSGDGSIVQVRGIDWRTAPYDWAFAREDTALIDAHWAARRAAKPDLYDGRVLLMHEAEIVKETLRCLCFEASFKSFLAWRELGFPGAPIFNCFGMAALQAADGPFMLGEMNARTAAAGRLYFPAGTPEPSDADAAGRVDLTANVLRELQEETGLKEGDVTLNDGWTVVRAGPYVACMKPIRTSMSSAQLQDRLAHFNTTQTNPELVRLVPITSRRDFDIARMPGFVLTYLDWTLKHDPEKLQTFRTRSCGKTTS